ncbi:MAG: hypothetical protein EZS28_029100 [Streblomastix strix]|uniref:Uncharacterized protein n=1 Tax=Streblomastix strix TaxID=222440 RepID=A0A5J4UZ07_9EUKA|nr:MAG: hypothetical protein EZS28_029100 [Streblomastix strix]
MQYAGVLIIAISTASGLGEEQDNEIYDRLINICWLLNYLQYGRTNNWQPSYPQFPPQLLLVKRSQEQIEEEGGNEEVDSQLINDNEIREEANWTKGAIMNIFIDGSNPKPRWY